MKPLFAMVLAPGHDAPAADAVAKAYAELSHGPAPKVSGGKPGALTLVADGVNALIAQMPVPVPNGEAEAAAPFSALTFGKGWTPAKHDQHFIVTVIAPERAEALSVLATALAAVAKATNATGIYWGGAGATHEPTSFIEIVGDCGGEVPALLWSGLSLGGDPRGRSLLSHGMRQFDLPELLVSFSKTKGNEALGTFFDLLDYLSTLGQRFDTSETIGRTATEKLPTRYVPSPLGNGAEVLEIQLP